MKTTTIYVYLLTTQFMVTGDQRPSARQEDTWCFPHKHCHLGVSLKENRLNMSVDCTCSLAKLARDGSTETNRDINWRACGGTVP